MSSLSHRIAEHENCGIIIGDNTSIPMFIGKIVNVYVGPWARGEDAFPTLISIRGQLEGLDDENGHPVCYRIVDEANDSNYTYFRPEDVVDVRYGVYAVELEDLPEEGGLGNAFAVMEDDGTQTYWRIAERMSERQPSSAVVRISVPRATEPELLDNGSELGDNPAREPSDREAT